MLNKKDMKRMLAYSDNIISAKPTPIYSVLKPDTNSDSPSAKSKGVRLVSAKIVINQQILNGRHRYTGHPKYEDLIKYVSRSRFLDSINGERMIMIKDTS